VEAEVSKVAMKQTAVGEEDVKVEGIGSGFIWDKFGHIVSHMVSLPMLYPHILRFSHFVLSLSLSLSQFLICRLKWGQVTNYHVVAKLAMDPSGRQKAQVKMVMHLHGDVVW
jgi:hypothetical protein